MKHRLWHAVVRRTPLGAVVCIASLALTLVCCRVLPPTLADPPVAQSAQAQELTPTPACSRGVITPPQTEGPFYKPNSPERTSLIEPGLPGTKLVITGYVFTSDCQPVAGAWLDFWQADASGSYDNNGYRLRGHQYTDATGRYSLETIIPGEYPGRTPHVHVKVQAPGQSALTTQLYFPGQPENSTDGIFNSALLLSIHDADDGKLAMFDFVLDLG